MNNNFGITLETEFYKKTKRKKEIDSNNTGSLCDRWMFIVEI